MWKPIQLTITIPEEMMSDLLEISKGTSMPVNDMIYSFIRNGITSSKKLDDISAKQINNLRHSALDKDAIQRGFDLLEGIQSWESR